MFSGPLAEVCRNITKEEMNEDAIYCPTWLHFDPSDKTNDC